MWLDEVNKISRKLGNLNEHTEHNASRKAHLINEMEGEARNNVFKGGDYYDEDNWEKDYSALTNDPVIFYRRSSGKSCFNNMSEHGFERDWVQNNALGTGIYGNFNLRQTLSSGYGEYLFKCELRGGLKNFLIFDGDALKALGYNSFLDLPVLKNKGFTDFLAKKHVNLQEIANLVDNHTDADSSTSMEACYPFIHAGGGQNNVARRLGQFGVEGILYYNWDCEGMCVYNIDLAVPVAYLNTDEIKLNPEDINNLPWKPFNVTPQESDLNDMEFFKQRFEARFQIDNYDRGINGAILCKDNKTGLFTFIDTEKAKQYFKNPDVDVRLFGDVEFEFATNFTKEGTARVTFTDDEHEYEINRKGDIMDGNTGEVLGNVFQNEEMPEVDDTTEEMEDDNFFDFNDLEENKIRNKTKYNMNKINESRLTALIMEAYNEVMEECGMMEAPINEEMDECGMCAAAPEAPINEEENDAIAESMKATKALMERMGCNLNEGKKTSKKSLMIEHYSKKF